MSRVLVIGNGWIASHLPYEVSTKRFLLPLRDQLRQDLSEGDTLINCIGRTGTPNVDWCETHRAETNYANTMVPVGLANICQEMGIHFVHIGSGCVYDGYDKYWEPSDPANPVNYYAKTKYATDLCIGDMSNVTILRIRMPICSCDHPHNLLTKLAGYNRIVKAYNSVTDMTDLVQCVNWAVQTHRPGIFHCVSYAPNMARMPTAQGKEKISIDELNEITVAKRSNCLLARSPELPAPLDIEPTNRMCQAAMKVGHE